MGAPKLLLPWQGSTVLGHLLQVWTESNISNVVVVIRNNDEALASVCRDWPVEIVRPCSDPRDMKQSIQFGLEHIEAVHHAGDQDRWLVAPADLPSLSLETINAVILNGLSCESITLPRFGKRRGHPVSFPWALARLAFQLGENEGIDRILATQSIFYIDFPMEAAIDDIDTPEDYRRLSPD